MPSDHFFDADLELIRVSADEAGKCVLIIPGPPNTRWGTYRWFGILSPPLGDLGGK